MTTSSKTKSKKEKLFGLVEDSVSDLLYHGRKEDADFPPGEIDTMIANGEVTTDEIIEIFAQSFCESLIS